MEPVLPRGGCWGQVEGSHKCASRDSLGIPYLPGTVAGTDGAAMRSSLGAPYFVVVRDLQV